MSKKGFTILILLILAILGGIWWYLFRVSPIAPAGDDNGDSSYIFPFGQRPTTTPTGTGGLVTNTGDTGTTTTIDLGAGSIEEIIPRLRQISAVPTAGAVAFNVGSSTIVRYIERATGHISEVQNDSAKVIKISNTTIPKVYEALWSNDGIRLLIRYIKDDSQRIRTFYARIATTTRPEQAIEGVFLADDIREISVSGSKAFYMTENTSGSTGVLSNMDGSSKTSVFNSSFADWRYSLASPSIATIFSRPSGTTEGSAYLLNVGSGNYTKISELPGLVALSNSDGSKVLLSAIVNRGLSTMVFDSKSGLSTDLGIQTIADKCVWSAKNKNIVFCSIPTTLPNAVYPDGWYKGQISFEDSLWKIDVASGETESLFTPELEAGVSMDIFKLSLDQKENTIIFTNKKDMTVWAYKLVE
jgi:hypothetical protein